MNSRRDTTIAAVSWCDDCGADLAYIFVDATGAYVLTTEHSDVTILDDRAAA